MEDVAVLDPHTSSLYATSPAAVYQYTSLRARKDAVAVSDFNNQVGGRAEIVSIKLGECKSIGKPLNKKEYQFYETATKSLPARLLDFIPCYKGVVELHDHNEDKQLKYKDNRCYIVLEDVTSSFSQPSIMDLKMGTRQYSDNMSPEKIMRKKKRSRLTTSNELGLRIAAIRSFNSNESCKHYHMDKMQGRKLNSETILDAFRMFFFNGEVTQYLAISEILTQLYTIIASMEDINELRLYCCSLLLVYESDMTKEFKTIIKIIDFAECQTQTGDGERYDEPDQGFLKGLESLAGLLRRLLQEGGAQIQNSSVTELTEEEDDDEDDLFSLRI